ncbi:ABC transporter permease [Skermanella stibiiresistens SB22]|uniref:ABC transporter permease n=1 Tax=Skermanella stibiiresistens SB22 TaxID=1385369 RepID=W9GW42_9PROT|nr:branched-chain amino acid ABC transporter permease [Skermanella stibiiresistens]EWY36647.1 ABC transporter permease [Skermanella stibiiresistens SB22]
MLERTNEGNKRETAAVLIGLALLVALPFLADAIGKGFYVTLFTRILILGLAAVSLDLILGYGGMVSFGHAAFVGIGAYVVGILSWHVFDGSPLMTWPVVIEGTENGFVVWPLAALMGALFALAIGAISLRTTGISFIMITLAFAQMLFYLAIGLRTYGGEDGIALYNKSGLGSSIDLFDKTTFYYVCLAILVVFVWLCRRLTRSRFGMVVRGARINERRMRALGFSPYRHKLTAFVISGAGAGLSGALLANAAEFVGPAYMSWQRSGELIVMVVLGGMGTLFGPVVGAAAFLLLEEGLADLTEHWQIVLGPVLLFVVVFARRGIWGWIAGPAREDR